MPSSGGVPERVTQHNAKVSFLAPLDSRTLLYVAPGRRPFGAVALGPRRGAQDLSQGKLRPRAILVRRGQRRWQAHRRDGGQSQRQPYRDVPLLGRLAEESDVRPFSLPAVRALAPRFRGTALFYLSAPRDRRRWDRRRVVALSRWKGIRDLEELDGALVGATSHIV